jgi:outer membrane protein assembly factor BamD (BamD/ComL family)
MFICRVRSVLVLVLLALLGSALLLQLGCAPKAPPEPQWETDARTLLDQAADLLAKRQYDLALKTVDTFMYQYPASRYRDRGLFLMGEARFVKRDYSRALRYYEELIKEFPSSSYILTARSKSWPFSQPREKANSSGRATATASARSSKKI